VNLFVQFGVDTDAEVPFVGFLRRASELSAGPDILIHCPMKIVLKLFVAECFKHHQITLEYYATGIT